MLPILINLAVASTLAPPKATLVMNGTFMEGCSCKGTCSFETTGSLPGCRGTGVYKVDKGVFGGKDISGLKIVWVSAPGDNLFIYVDGKSAAQKKTGEKLSRILFAEGSGTLRSVKQAPIALTGSKGKFRLLVGYGRTLDMATVPILGGDGKSLIRIDNVFGDPYDSLYQAKTVRATFKEGEHSFELNASCSFFSTLKVNKKI